MGLPASIDEINGQGFKGLKQKNAKNITVPLKILFKSRRDNTFDSIFISDSGKGKKKFKI